MAETQQQALSEASSPAVPPASTVGDGKSGAAASASAMPVGGLAPYTKTPKVGHVAPSISPEIPPPRSGKAIFSTALCSRPPREPVGPPYEPVIVSSDKHRAVFEFAHYWLNKYPRQYHCYFPHCNFTIEDLFDNADIHRHSPSFCQEVLKFITYDNVFRAKRLAHEWSIENRERLDIVASDIYDPSAPLAVVDKIFVKDEIKTFPREFLWHTANIMRMGMLALSEMNVGGEAAGDTASAPVQAHEGYARASLPKVDAKVVPRVDFKVGSSTSQMPQKFQPDAVPSSEPQLDMPDFRSQYRPLSPPPLHGPHHMAHAPSQSLHRDFHGHGPPMAMQPGFYQHSPSMPPQQLMNTKGRGTRRDSVPLNHSRPRVYPENMVRQPSDHYRSRAHSGTISSAMNTPRSSHAVPVGPSTMMHPSDSNMGFSSRLPGHAAFPAMPSGMPPPAPVSYGPMLPGTIPNGYVFGIQSPPGMAPAPIGDMTNRVPPHVHPNPFRHEPRGYPYRRGSHSDKQPTALFNPYGSDRPEFANFTTQGPRKSTRNSFSYHQGHQPNRNRKFSSSAQHSRPFANQFEAEPAGIIQRQPYRRQSDSAPEMNMHFPARPAYVTQELVDDTERGCGERHIGPKNDWVKYLVVFGIHADVSEQQVKDLFEGAAQAPAVVRAKHDANGQIFWKISFQHVAQCRRARQQLDQSIHWGAPLTVKVPIQYYEMHGPRAKNKFDTTMNGTCPPISQPSNNDYLPHQPHAAANSKSSTHEGRPISYSPQDARSDLPASTIAPEIVAGSPQKRILKNKERTFPAKPRARVEKTVAKEESSESADGEPMQANEPIEKSIAGGKHGEKTVCGSDGHGHITVENQIKHVKKMAVGDRIRHAQADDEDKTTGQDSASGIPESESTIVQNHNIAVSSHSSQTAYPEVTEQVKHTTKEEVAETVALPVLVSEASKQEARPSQQRLSAVSEPARDAKVMSLTGEEFTSSSLSLPDTAQQNELLEKKVADALTCDLVISDDDQKNDTSFHSAIESQLDKDEEVFKGDSCEVQPSSTSAKEPHQPRPTPEPEASEQAEEQGPSQAKKKIKDAAKAVKPEQAGLLKVTLGHHKAEEGTEASVSVTTKSSTTGSPAKATTPKKPGAAKTESLSIFAKSKALTKKEKEAAKKAKKKAKSLKGKQLEPVDTSKDDQAVSVSSVTEAHSESKVVLPKEDNEKLLQQPKTMDNKKGKDRAPQMTQATNTEGSTPKETRPSSQQHTIVFGAQSFDKDTISQTAIVPGTSLGTSDDVLHQPEKSDNINDRIAVPDLTLLNKRSTSPTTSVGRSLDITAKTTPSSPDKAKNSTMHVQDSPTKKEGGDNLSSGRKGSVASSATMRADSPPIDSPCPTTEGFFTPAQTPSALTFAQISQTSGSNDQQDSPALESTKPNKKNKKRNKKKKTSCLSQLEDAAATQPRPLEGVEVDGQTESKEANDAIPTKDGAAYKAQKTRVETMMSTDKGLPQHDDADAHDSGVEGPLASDGEISPKHQSIFASIREYLDDRTRVPTPENRGTGVAARATISMTEFQQIVEPHDPFKERDITKLRDYPPAPYAGFFVNGAGTEGNEEHCEI